MKRFYWVFAAMLWVGQSMGAHADAPGLGNQAWGPGPVSEWGKNNLHLIEEDAATGYAIYRASAPDRAAMRRFCELGITEMMVLSGTAAKRENKYASECPTLKVVHNVEQRDAVPVSREFLNHFDGWVEDARRNGKKIAFRCECGCHRTGRLAAYYQMKYQRLSFEDATRLLSEHGRWMFFFPHIYKQVKALSDYVSGRACSTRAKYCVRE